MKRPDLDRLSEVWLKLLLRLYPKPFRDELGTELTETYLDRFRALRTERGSATLPFAWLEAASDSIRNGLAERLWPSSPNRTRGAGMSRSAMARRRSRRVLAYSLAVSGLAHVAIFAFWSYEVRVEPFSREMVSLHAISADSVRTAFVEVSFGPPAIFTAEGTVQEEPPDRVLDVGRVLWMRPECTAALVGRGGALSGRVRLQVGAAGRVEMAQLIDGTGDACGDETILRVANVLWYHWLPDERYPAPVRLEQPIELADAREWNAL